MNLNQFLDQSDRSLRDIAKSFGISVSYLSEIKDGKKEPSPRVARKIVAGTAGMVSFEEVFGEAMRRGGPRRHRKGGAQ
jgi:transcriptional regulator with XRE-family HTH domain